MASLLGKHQIAINTADLASGDSIAAYLVSAAGDLITSTTIGAKEHEDVLDAASHLQGTAYAAGTDYLMSAGVVDDAGNWVPLTLNAAGELPVAASINMAGDYAEDSVHADGDVGLFTLLVRQDTLAASTSADGDYGAFKSNNLGELYVHDTSALAELVLIKGDTASIDATATSIDGHVAQIETDTTAILAELLDQGVTLDSILADTATIDSQTLSIQNTLTALSKAEDAAHVSGDQGVQALAVRKDAQGSNVSADGDYASLQVWSEGSMKVVDIANGAMLQQQVSVTSTAAAVPASALANRKSLMLQNTSAAKIWIGSATVTTSGATAGIELPANSFMELEVGPAVAVYAIKSGAGSLNLNVLEMA